MPLTAVAAPVRTQQPQAHSGGNQPATASPALSQQQTSGQQMPSRTQVLRGKPQFGSVIDVLNGGAAHKSAWNLGVEYHDAKYPLKTVDEAVAAMGAYRPNPNDPEAELFAKYGNDLVRLLQALPFCGSDRTQYLHSDRPPVRFALNNNKLCVLIGGIASDTVYNTIKLSSRRRAGEALRSAVLPALSYLDPVTSQLNLEYFGLIYVYGSKSFADDSVGATKPEAVCLVVSRTDCHKYVAAEISQDELLRRALVFFSDRDALLDFTRIELTME